MIKVIIDTDIGDDVDDAFAVALALKSPQLDVIGITTVFKNVKMRSKIVKAQLQAFQKTNIDVVSGLDNPLVVAPSVFKYEKIGEDGKPIITAFDNCYLSDGDRDDAPRYLLEKAKEFPHEITILAIGPLTNIATAILLDPEGFKLFKEIVMMGGSNHNNREWNILCDPEAADVVLKCGVPIRAIPIECTNLCVVEDNFYDKLLNPKNDEELFLLDMYKKWRKDQTRPCQMHDCLAVQELLKSYCKLEKRYIYSSLKGDELGKTITISDRKPNVKIAISVEAKEFMNSLLHSLYSC